MVLEPRSVSTNKSKVFSLMKATSRKLKLRRRMNARPKTEAVKPPPPRKFMKIAKF